MNKTLFYFHIGWDWPTKRRVQNCAVCAMHEGVPIG